MAFAKFQENRRKPWVTGRLGPYTNTDPIPTRTLDQLGHYHHI